MPENYFLNYLPLLIHFLFACGFAVAVVTLSWIIGVRKPTRAKMAPYECGVAPIGDAQGRFSVKFYLVAMLFILFDVEVVFMMPWAVIFRELPKITGSAYFGFWEMLVYLGFVAVGLYYIVKKGILDWSNDKGDL
jgi:NADH-quinone oxidoreductase subunit A